MSINAYRVEVWSLDGDAERKMAEDACDVYDPVIAKSPEQAKIAVIVSNDMAVGEEGEPDGWEIVVTGPFAAA